MNFDAANSLWNQGRMTAFFDSMPDTESLMEFSRVRKGIPDPRMVVQYTQTPPPDTIAAVILSPAFDDPLAQETERMLARWDRVFVTGKSPYFNESRYFNAGIERALKLDPKWIVLMCDDLKETDHFGVLVRHLLALDNKATDVVWVDPKPNYYHSCVDYFTPVPSAQILAEKLIGNSSLNQMREKYHIKSIVSPEHPIRKPFRYWLFHTVFRASFQRQELKFRLTGDLAILSAEWCRNNLPVYDEMFIGNQDVDLSLRLAKARSATVDFQIGSEIGGHYKPSITKAMREVFNLAILNRYMKEGHYR